MEMPKNYDETQGITGDYETLEPGGYICKVINAKEETSKNGNQMIVIAFDIAEGEKEGFFQKKYDEAKKQNTDVNNIVKWPNNGVHRLMLLDNEGNCNKFFKGFITSVELSNTGYDFKKSKFNEKTLKDKLFGGLFGKEEYERLDGTTAFATKLRFIRTVEKIKSGDFETPADKLLPKSQKGDSFENFANINMSSDDDDLPF